MRRSAVTLLAAGLVACSSGGGVPPIGDGKDSGPGSDAATKDAAADVATSDAASDGGSDASDANASDAGGPTFVDVADTTCQGLASDAGAVLVAGPGAPRFTTTAAVSSRRFAASEDQVLTFDTDGANAGAPFAPPAIDAIVDASEGSAIAVASLNSGAVGFTRYDASGAVTLATQTLQASTPAGDPALAIASRSGASLVVWRQGTNLRGLEYTTSAGATVDFGASTFGSSVDVAAAPTSNGYVVAWTGDPGDGTYRLRFTTWGATSNVTVSYKQTAPMHVVRIVPAASGSGWAALVNSEFPQAAVLLVPLDASGNVSGSIRRYLGATYAWDVASSNAGYALVARRATNEPEWRSLTTSGDGQSSWVCLDGSLGNQIGGSAVDSDGTLWATVYSTQNGGASFVRLDSTGTP